MPIIISSNGNPLPQIQTANVKGFRAPGKVVKNVDSPRSCLISQQLIQDTSFIDIYAAWIQPCVDFIREFKDGFLSDSQINDLFYKEQNDEEQQKQSDELYTEFFSLIDGKGPYFNALGQSRIWSPRLTGGIATAVDQALVGVAAHIRLRVKIVCLLLGGMPEDVFVNGKRWSNDFLPNPIETLGTEETDERNEFTLSISPVKELKLKILRNTGDMVRSIVVSYGRRKYTVKIPPHGYVKALFNNDELAGIKGCISCHSVDVRSAFVHVTGGTNPGVYECYKPNAPSTVNTDKNALDVAAHGEYGAVFLYSHELYDFETGRTLKTEKLPVCLYGAGSDWAFQYADGHLDTSLLGPNGSKVEYARMIVENGDMSLLIVDEQGTWDFGSTSLKKIKITEEEFVEAMMARFQHADACEQISTSYGATLRIKLDGNIEVKWP